jgi:hypothetical protein
VGHEQSSPPFHIHVGALLDAATVSFDAQRLHPHPDTGATRDGLSSLIGRTLCFMIVCSRVRLTSIQTSMGFDRFDSDEGGGRCQRRHTELDLLKELRYIGAFSLSTLTI